MHKYRTKVVRNGKDKNADASAFAVTFRHGDAPIYQRNKIGFDNVKSQLQNTRGKEQFTENPSIEFNFNPHRTITKVLMSSKLSAYNWDYRKSIPKIPGEHNDIIVFFWGVVIIDLNDTA